MYIICTVFFIRVLNVHTLNTHKNDTHWLTQWTRAHYCWQIFAFEATAFVYPLAVSTEAQFDQGWKRLRGEAQLTPSVQRPHLRSTTLVLKGGSLSLESYPFFHPAPGKTWRNIPLNHSLENWKNIVKMRTMRMFVFFSREAIGSSEYSAPMCVCLFFPLSFLSVDSQIAFQIAVCGSLYLLWQISSLNSPPPKCCLSFILITPKQHKFSRG